MAVRAEREGGREGGFGFGHLAIRFFVVQIPLLPYHFSVVLFQLFVGLPLLSAPLLIFLLSSLVFLF